MSKKKQLIGPIGALVAGGQCAAKIAARAGISRQHLAGVISGQWGASEHVCDKLAAVCSLETAEVRKSYCRGRVE